MRAFLGVDLGTSGLKAALLDEAGAVLAEAEAAYGMLSPQPGWAEADPVVWTAAYQCVRGELAAVTAGVELAGIGIAGQMHGVVLVDADGALVRPAILWPDRRSEGVLSAWQRLPQRERARLANPLAAGMAGPVLTWLALHEPETLRRAATLLSPKDWLRSALTGDRVTERSDASATLLWDVSADTWSQPALAVAGISDAQLPALRSCDEVVGTDDGVPVAAGGADVACALQAMSAVWTGALVVNAGSGVQVLRPGVTPAPRVDPVTQLHADSDGGWYEMVGVRNGGLSLAWVQRALRLSWPALFAAAGSAGPGAEVFVPFLTGERGGVAPVVPRAGWAGLSQSTGVADLARAAFEALAFTIRRSVDLLGDSDSAVLLSGGVAREPYVRQLLANCLGRPLGYTPLRSASAVGAALLAARAVGADIRLPDDTMVVHPRVEDRLEAAYSRWRQVVASTAQLSIPVHNPATIRDL